jgi:hypothetical protein
MLIFRWHGLHYSIVDKLSHDYYTTKRAQEALAGPARSHNRRLSLLLSIRPIPLLCGLRHLLFIN